VKIGKLSNDDLRSLVLDRLPAMGCVVATGPSAGLDCAAVKFGDGQVILTTDPITGAADQIGRLAVDISCNDIACCGIRPSAVMLVIIAPPTAERGDIALVIDQAAEAAKRLCVSIIGGHTEISDAVGRFVAVTTAMGFTYGGKIIQASGGRPGDALVMTKTAGLEGTAIFAADQNEKLSGCLTVSELEEAKSLINSISVVEEGSCGGKIGVSAMHDATEGGILGACWEMADASRLGCIIDAGQIPLHPLTVKICGILSVDPLRLVSSGSMLIATPDPDRMIAELAAKGILGTMIGSLTNEPGRMVVYDGRTADLLPPGPDELYKIK
jgi:hydrogenase expression/formation protein HypE